MQNTKPLSISVDDATIQRLKELKAKTNLNASQIIKHLIAKMAADEVLQKIIVKVVNKEKQELRIMSIRSNEKKVADPDAGEAVSLNNQDIYNPYNRVKQAASHWDPRIEQIIEDAKAEWHRREQN